ncbi:Clp protease N-terminal domain-containing protein [Streptomyces sp. NBC_01216]|uniref:Clp protease N-terminal domain-containing protein n=1 Tax=Streptomyces sp. NPDC048577 TaxID=3157209 RepID=UPI002E10015D|nr:peptidase [Streptomyces sp. NBC_01216]
MAAGLTPALATVALGAHRRALRAGDRQIDTAHLLHSLLESDPDVRASFADSRRLARVLGYLVQRSIGYGLRWQRAVEGAGGDRAARLPVRAGTPGVPDRTPASAPSGWSPAALAALDAARERAVRRGEAHPRGLDLFAAISAAPGCRGAEVLRRAGVDTASLTARIGEPSQQA